MQQPLIQLSRACCPVLHFRRSYTGIMTSFALQQGDKTIFVPLYLCHSLSTKPVYQLSILVCLNRQVLNEQFRRMRLSATRRLAAVNHVLGLPVPLPQMVSGQQKAAAAAALLNSEVPESVNCQQAMPMFQRFKLQMKYMDNIKRSIQWTRCVHFADVKACLHVLDSTRIHRIPVHQTSSNMLCMTSMHAPKHHTCIHAEVAHTLRHTKLHSNASHCAALHHMTLSYNCHTRALFMQTWDSHILAVQNKTIHTYC